MNIVHKEKIISGLLIQHEMCVAPDIDSYCIHNDAEQKLILTVKSGAVRIQVDILWCPFCGFHYHE